MEEMQFCSQTWFAVPNCLALTKTPLVRVSGSDGNQDRGVFRFLVAARAARGLARRNGGACWVGTGGRSGRNRWNHGVVADHRLRAGFDCLSARLFALLRVVRARAKGRRDSEGTRAACGARGADGDADA